MITFENIWNIDELVFILAGELDDTTDLFRMASSIPQKACFNTRGITRVNSVGVRRWISLLEQCKAAETRIRYVECSYAFTVHLVTFLTASGDLPAVVESVIAPFACRKCNFHFEKLVQTPGTHALKAQITGVLCPRCGVVAEFDEIPVEYFSFLNLG